LRGIHGIRKIEVEELILTELSRVPFSHAILLETRTDSREDKISIVSGIIQTRETSERECEDCWFGTAFACEATIKRKGREIKRFGSLA